MLIADLRVFTWPNAYSRREASDSVGKYILNIVYIVMNRTHLIIRIEEVGASVYINVLSGILSNQFLIFAVRTYIVSINIKVSQD